MTNPKKLSLKAYKSRVLLAIALAVSTPVMASSYKFINYSFSDGSGTESKSIIDPVGTIVAQKKYISPVTGGSSSGSISASAEYGALKVSSYSLGSFLNSNSAGVEAVMYDTLKITSAGLEGTIGHATIRMDYQWNQIIFPDFGGQGWGQVSPFLGFAGSGVQVIQSASVGCSTDNECTYSDNPTHTVISIPGVEPYPTIIANKPYVTVQIPFVFGQESQLYLGIYANTYANGNALDAHPFSSIDATHSVYWGGVSDVTDSAGNIVTFALQSESGTDYRNSFKPASAVPEPATYMLLLAGLIAMGIVSRRGVQ